MSLPAKGRFSVSDRAMWAPWRGRSLRLLQAFVHCSLTDRTGPQTALDPIVAGAIRLEANRFTTPHASNDPIAHAARPQIRGRRARPGRARPRLFLPGACGARGRARPPPPGPARRPRGDRAALGGARA